MSGQTIQRRDFFKLLLGRREPTGPPVARIDRSHCLAWQKSLCFTCSERCPEEGAIEVRFGRPHINPDPCTGCGICRDVCPAPVNAISIVREG